MRNLKRYLLVISTILPVATAGAFVKYTSPWTGTNAQVGISVKSGNNDSQDYTGKLNVYHRKNRFNKIGKLEAALSKSKDIFTKENVYGEGQLQYYFIGSNHLYLETDAIYDRFSPYIYQTSVAIGYGRNIFKTKHTKLDLEAGPGYMQSKAQSTGAINDQFIADLESNFYWNITKNCIFHQALFVKAGQKYTYTRAITSFRNNIMHHFGIQISFKLENYSHIPSGSKRSKRTDTTTETALIYNF